MRPLTCDRGHNAGFKRHGNIFPGFPRRLDILVNNAGLETHAPFWDVAEEDYDKVLNVNLKGVFFASQSFVRHLMQSNRLGPCRVPAFE
jgi:NAD(P)-dependent dehydrogenase (short-subunit alcohol dehydrogenase family)